MTQYLYLAEKAAQKKDRDGHDVRVYSHGQVYTTEGTYCRVTHHDYDVVCQRVKRITDLLNEHGE